MFSARLRRTAVKRISPRIPQICTDFFKKSVQICGIRGEKIQSMEQEQLEQTTALIARDVGLGNASSPFTEGALLEAMANRVAEMLT